MKPKPWDVFRSTLKAEMSRAPRISVAELAERLDVSDEVVSNWRQGRTRPPLESLPGLVEALNQDRVEEGEVPSFTIFKLLGEMGILPKEPTDDEVFDRALRLQKLNLDLAAAHLAAAEAGRSGGGVAPILGAAAKSARWAVAVWPAYEGPDPRSPMHVADRIDIVDQLNPLGLLLSDDVWQDPAMRGALRSAYAVPSAAQPRWSAPHDKSVSTWSVAHIGSPRAPVKENPWPNLRGISFVSTTLDTWVGDVADLTALAIGYGYTSTRDLAMEMYGMENGRTRLGDRWKVHEKLLADPPRRRVWSHFGPLEDRKRSPFSQPRNRRTEGLQFVLIDESDELLSVSAESWKDRPSAPTIEELRRSRDKNREFAAVATSGSVFVLQAEHFSDRNSRWAQCFRHCSAVVKHLESQGVEFDNEEMTRVWAKTRRQYVEVADPFFSWLESN